MGSVIGCGLPRDLITIEYKVAALFFFKLLLAFGGTHMLRGRGIGGGGVSRRVGRLHSRAVIHVGAWWPFPPGR